MTEWYMNEGLSQMAEHRRQRNVNEYWNVFSGKVLELSQKLWGKKQIANKQDFSKTEKTAKETMEAKDEQRKAHQPAETGSVYMIEREDGFIIVGIWKMIYIMWKKQQMGCEANSSKNTPLPIRFNLLQPRIRMGR